MTVPAGVPAPAVGKSPGRAVGTIPGGGPDAGRGGGVGPVVGRGADSGRTAPTRCDKPPARAMAVASPSRKAMGVLTFTSAVPSATSSFATRPASTASTSMVALSVSTSAITSPGFTCWPSLTRHFASLPLSMVGDNVGITIWIGIAFDPLLLLGFTLAKAHPARQQGNAGASTRGVAPSTCPMCALCLRLDGGRSSLARQGVGDLGLVAARLAQHGGRVGAEQ